MKELGKRSIEMETLLIIGALAAGAHYMTKDDDVDLTKHQVVDVVDVRTANFDMTHSKSIAKGVSGGYYFNGTLQNDNSAVKWVIE